MSRATSPGSRFTAGSSLRTSVAHNRAVRRNAEGRAVTLGKQAANATLPLQQRLFGEMTAQGHAMGPWEETTIARFFRLALYGGGSAAGRRSRCSRCGAWVEIAVQDQSVSYGDAGDSPT